MKKYYAGWYITRNLICAVLVLKRRGRLQLISTAERQIIDGEKQRIFSLIDEIITREFKGRLPEYNILCFTLAQLYREKIQIPVRRASEMQKILINEVGNSALLKDKMHLFASEMISADDKMQYMVFGIEKDFLQSVSEKLHIQENRLNLCVAEDALLEYQKTLTSLSKEYNSLMYFNEDSISLIIKKENRILYAENYSLTDDKIISDAVRYLMFSAQEVTPDALKDVALIGNPDFIKETISVFENMKVETHWEKTLKPNIGISIKEIPAYCAVESFIKKRISYLPINIFPKQRQVLEKVNAILVLFLIGTFLMLTGQFVVFQRLRAKDVVLKKLMSDEAGVIIGKNRPLINPMEQVKAVLKKSDIDRSAFEDGITAAPESFILLDQSIAGMDGIKVDSLSYGKDAIRISGTGQDFGDLQEWKNKIMKIKQILKVDIENAVRDNSTGTVNFTMKIEYKKS